MADQKVTELKDLKVGEVSLVDQAAIGRTWLVTKRAENNTEKAMPANAKAEDAPKAAEAVETTKSAEQIDKSAEPIGTVETVTKAVRYMDIWMSVDDPSAQAVAAFFGSMTEELQKRGIDTPEDLAKMADELEALKKSQAEADEIVTKAKHFTATRTEAIQGAVETLQSVLTEVTANDIAVDASPVEETIASAEDTAVAKAMTAMTAVLEKVSSTNETIAKALANSKAKVAASEDALAKAKAKNETLEKAVETLETTQPPAASEAPVVKSDGKVETVRKSDDELFGFVGR